MKITEMIKQLGGNRAAIAEQAEISIQQLNNMVSKNQEVELLQDGTFVAVRSNAVRFKGNNQ